MKNKVSQLVLRENFILMILSNQRKKTQDEKKCQIKPIILKNKKLFQFSIYSNTKVFHKNIEPENVGEEVVSLMESSFKQANIFTGDEDVQIMANKVEKPKFITSAPSKKSKDNKTFSHNQKKNYIIPEGEYCDFLVYLGVMNKDGKVLKANYNKFKQINRFLEILRDALKDSKDLLKDSKDEVIRIIDFGCGKAYLTFAIYYYLVKILHLQVEIIGIDLKEDVINFCNKVAKDLSYDGLKFEKGDIATYKNTFCHIVVSLHACDTATDYGLINAVKWNSKIILSVPCCQHELFEQIDNSLLNSILKHGINKDKFTELLTNGLRALKLESVGYGVSMVEFTSLEHTAKNVVIRAVKTNKAIKSKEKALNEYNKLKNEFKVKPTIDKL